MEGDYKNPPAPGQFERLEQQSRRLLKRLPVLLSPQAVRLASRALAASLRQREVKVIAVSVDEHHFHLLAKFLDLASPPPGVTRRDFKTALALVRHLVGIAKKESARALCEKDLVRPGGVWAVRARCLPIHDRSHQINVYRYIVAHGDRKASVWTFRDSDV